MSQKLTAKGARSVVASLENTASLFQDDHELLGVDKKTAMDFAYRCDLLCDHIEKFAGLDKESFEKEALDELDPVDETTFAPHHFDGEHIGEEKAGPHQKNPDETYMNGEFTQQENRELRERQQAGELGGVIPAPQTPTPGKQASSEKISELSELQTKMEYCKAKLDASDSELKKLSGSLKEHADALGKLKQEMMKADATGDLMSLEQVEACARIMAACKDVLSHLRRSMMRSQDMDSLKPSEQLATELSMNDRAEYLQQLMGLSKKMVSKSLQAFSKPEKKEASHDFNLFA